MKFTLENNAQVNVVRAYSRTQLRVGDTTLSGSCIIAPDRLIGDWDPQRFEDLTVAHLEPIFALAPQVVLLATGERQRFAPASVRAAFAERGLGLEVMDLGAACRTYNILVQEERRAVAGIFFD